MDKLTMVKSINSVRIRILLALLLIGVGVYALFLMCYISPPLMNEGDIQVFGGRDSAFVLLKENEPLYSEIISWTSKKRWCYPSFVNYVRRIVLIGANGDGEKINIWGNKLIFQYYRGLNLQYETLFFTNEDERLYQKLTAYYLEKNVPQTP